MSVSGQWRNLSFGEAGEDGDDVMTGDQNAGSSNVSRRGLAFDPLWTPEQVAQRLNVSPDWVRDHSSRKEPRLFRQRSSTWKIGGHCLGYKYS
jgi:hypothetical protein